MMVMNETIKCICGKSSSDDVVKGSIVAGVGVRLVIFISATAFGLLSYKDNDELLASASFGVIFLVVLFDFVNFRIKKVKYESAGHSKGCAKRLAWAKTFESRPIN
jgi:hypothetical protein